MHRSITSIAAVGLILVAQSGWSDDDVFPLTNVTITLNKRGGREGYDIDAIIKNPNDFAIYEVQVNCDIRDRRGHTLASYASLIPDAVQAREVRTIRRLNIGAWPAQGRSASCRSFEAKKLPERLE
jgi:hypothetical protein